ncbi:MAG: hypothetical protein ACXQTR_00320 [Candidatus Methanospirareceae archaeon]
MKKDDMRAVELFESGLDIIASLGGSVLERKGAILNLFKKSLPSVAGMVLVEYIGSKRTYTDCLYTTGVWNKGVAKRVSMAQGVKLLKHPDVYREYKAPIDIVNGTIEDVPEPDIEKKDPDKLSFDQKKEIFHNQLLSMSNSAELRTFSKENLSGFEPDARLKDTGKITELIMAHIGTLGEGCLP